MPFCSNPSEIVEGRAGAHVVHPLCKTKHDSRGGLGRWNIKMITSDEDDPEKGLISFLERIQWKEFEQEVAKDTEVKQDSVATRGRQLREGSHPVTFESHECAVDMPGCARHMPFSSYLSVLCALLFKSIEIVKGNNTANVVHLSLRNQTRFKRRSWSVEHQDEHIRRRRPRERLDFVSRANPMRRI